MKDRSGDHLGMNARFMFKGRRAGAQPSVLHDDLIASQAAVQLGRSCCCPARPVVRVMIPPGDKCQRWADLLLCGHHYRVSLQALLDAKAEITELTAPGAGHPEALLPEIPAHAAPVR
jgi:hypothetical protein